MDNITVSLGSSKNAANEGGTCPKCGGSKPTCCRCPEPERQPIGPSWEALTLEQLRLVAPRLTPQQWDALQQGEAVELFELKSDQTLFWMEDGRFGACTLEGNSLTVRPTYPVKR